MKIAMLVSLGFVGLSLLVQGASMVVFMFDFRSPLVPVLNGCVWLALLGAVGGLLGMIGVMVYEDGRPPSSSSTEERGG